MAVDVIQGNTPKAIVRWRNRGITAYKPTFRFDIKKPGLFETWLEGPLLQPIAALGPGLTEDLRVYGPKVPADWPVGTTVLAKLMVIGLEGAQWSSTDAFKVVSALPTPRWTEATYIGAGVTIVRVEATATGYVYYIEFSEMPGEIYGPLTEAEVLAQIGG